MSTNQGWAGARNVARRSYILATSEGIVRETRLEK